MTAASLMALAGFAFVMSISPGPANFLLLTSGVNFGFWRTLRLILGISTGFLSMVLAIGLGLGQILHDHPTIYLGLRFVCMAYVIWLAIKIARVRSLGNAGRVDMVAPVGFFQAAALQLVNPKAWSVALIVTVSYTTPANYLHSLIVMIAVFALVNVPSISSWALFGTVLRRFLDNDRKVHLFNIAMAVLLVGSMLPVLWHSTPQ